MLQDRTGKIFFSLDIVSGQTMKSGTILGDALRPGPWVEHVTKLVTKAGRKLIRKSQPQLEKSQDARRSSVVKGAT